MERQIFCSIPGSYIWELWCTIPVNCIYWEELADVELSGRISKMVITSDHPDKTLAMMNRSAQALKAAREPVDA